MPELLAIVSVDPANRVRCGQPACSHSVYRRIHVVKDSGELLVLGSTCCRQRFGSLKALGLPAHGGVSGRKLTEAERQLLVSNTAALLAQFELERQPPPLLAKTTPTANTKSVHQVHRTAFTPTLQKVKASPWPWMKPRTSMAYFHLRDGTGWMRVQHIAGHQILLPWPTFDGWDEALPAHIGAVDPNISGLVMNNLIAAVGYLRERADWELVSGVWREIVDEIARRNRD